MREIRSSAIAIVGVGAVLPDAPTADTFWQNIKSGRYSINEVPEDRWDPVLFWDPDPKTPAKTYSKIGGWVREWEWDPIAWHLPIPPRVAAAMDRAQKWSVAGARQALADYGFPQRSLNRERTAVIIGNAMAGDQHYLTAIRVFLPEYELELARCEAFSELEPDLQRDIRRQFGERIARHFPEITEDSMPGELGNIIAGRVANLFDLRGPNFVTDAACASAMAAIGAAIEGLEEHDFDAVVTGGVDSNMSASTFTKFCKIGALSATGTRPYAQGADGFVMGEGAALFVLKRLEDAVRDDDPIYALIRSVGGSSDGRGKGITAPNPVGQRLAVERAWNRAGLVPDETTLIEGHGTSTRVGDVVEMESLMKAFAPFALERGSVPIGSVKSNIGHLKGAAGAAGVLKAAFALRDRMLPPSIGCEQPNPQIDFDNSPFYVQRKLDEWPSRNGQVRRAGVSAFGFGGTNFHLVLEEYRSEGPRAKRQTAARARLSTAEERPATAGKRPLRGALVLGADDETSLAHRLRGAVEEAKRGIESVPEPPLASDLAAPVRIAIDYGDREELVKKADKALSHLENGRTDAWRSLQSRGVFFGKGPRPRIAMLFTGQGSQYLNMLRELVEIEPIVAETFAEADEVMTRLLGRPLTEFLFLDTTEPELVTEYEQQLRQTDITQPAVLTVDIALQRLLAAYGVLPDCVMGHSLGEYGALVASGAMGFRQALAAVSARGAEMSRLAVEDNGRMAAVFAPLEEIDRVLAAVDGYVVVANLNSPSEAVIGGATRAVEDAVSALNQAGFDARSLPVSHAFHTDIVAPVEEPLRAVLGGMDLTSPSLPVVSNVTGQFYPMRPGVEGEMIDLLARQVSSPVQFVRGLETLYGAGVRLFVEVGPKRALQGMVRGVFQDRDDVLALSTNHPRLGDVVSFNQALCGLWAAGLGVGTASETVAVRPSVGLPRSAVEERGRDSTYLELGRMFAEVLERGMEMYGRGRVDPPRRPVVVTGAALGLPGTDRVFDDQNTERLLRGQQFIRPIPQAIRQGMVDKNITRLIKSEKGEPRFEAIRDDAEVIKLAARAGELDLVGEFGFPPDRAEALDTVSKLAIGAGLEALRDAGIPLVMRYKTTTKGTRLPDSWGLPSTLRDDTGVIFAAAFPGIDFFADETRRYYEDRARRQRIAELEELRAQARLKGDGAMVEALDERIGRHDDKAEGYTFERRFLFKLLAMAHSQFAELIGARGPNTQINSACASGTQAVGLAEDWIRAGRCRRVIIISADNVTSDRLLEWIGAGFLATGAAATDERVEEAAIPFDRRRHGMIVGMGAAALVVESADSADERGLQPIGEVLSTVTGNSAFHGTRLDVEHISEVMETLISKAEADWGLDRLDIAPRTVFISHETYTPARGGSAQAEIFALRRVFGAAAEEMVIANTKGYTGHPMGVAIEDVLAVKALETGIVPPVANIREIDPELGNLNLSTGGSYPVEYALRLGAGFGSQISMSLLRWVPPSSGRRPKLDQLGYESRVSDPGKWAIWLQAASGQVEPILEVDHRVLRVRDRGPAGAVEERVFEGAVATDGRAPGVGDLDVSASSSDAAVAGIPPAGGSETGSDLVTQRVLRLVSELTGYPEDMLDLDLDMEADLGIDTVKQAEMFAAIRQEWEIPRDENLQLRDFPTLAHAIQFVHERRPDLGSSSALPPSSDASDRDPVTQRVLRLVSELTGYPEDMLDLDLDMEADLGIDTVKQAEMFAAIRQEWEIPRDENLQLRDFPTLAHAIQFVHERKPETAPTGAAVEPAGVEAAPAPSDVETADHSVRFPRRVPVAIPRPSIDLFKTTASSDLDGKRIVVMPDEGGVGLALGRRIDRLGADVLMLEGSPGPQGVADQARRWIEQGHIDGVYWLPALDTPEALSERTLDQWWGAIDRCVKSMHSLMQVLWDGLGREPGAFLVTATRMGGRHGYDEVGAVAPLGGAVAGFSKAFKRERPNVVVKVVDFAPDAGAADTAECLIDETRRDPGVVEVGYREGRRWTVGLIDEPCTGDGAPLFELAESPVFLVTGAAGSIVSAIVTDLAQRWPGHFYLADLTPTPEPDDPDLALFGEDREALKRRLFDRLKAAGEKATPAAVEKLLARLERSQAALDSCRAIENAGGEAHYRCVDLLDSKVVKQLVDEITETHGRLDVLVHAAGLEISHLLPDKTASEFDLVFDVKAGGWLHLFEAAGDLPIGAVVVFSSIAGRFGNEGQTDYSAANDLLCKLTSNLRTTRPGTRGIAIDWSAWSEIGMASRGSIPKIMEQAGIDMLPPAEGISVVAREIAASSGQEIVVAGSLGSLLDEWDPKGGLQVEALEARFIGPMLARVARFELYRGLEVTVDLDPTQQPFLTDHRIEGIPVLPGVMGIEAFAELASALFPDRSVAAIRQVEFRAPFKFYRDEPRQLAVEARFESDGESTVLDCRLTGKRVLAKADRSEETTHFQGEVVMSERRQMGGVAALRPAEIEIELRSETIYSVYFHGPSYQVVAGAAPFEGGLVARLAEDLPDNHRPAASATVIRPRWLELCFQAAGLLQIRETGRVGLPLAVDQIELYSGIGAIDGPVWAVVEQTDGGSFDAAVVDTDGQKLLTVSGYRTVESPMRIDAEALAAVRAALMRVRKGALS